jgi:hypothetical protein
LDDLMPRRKLRPDIEAQVLTRSRRRCAFCFGLDRDAALKAGQIAHIDHDATNDNLDNLVFLCFEHHDVYDSKTSQRKNFTQTELRHFRSELDQAVRSFLGAPVIFGTAEIVERDPIAGRYVRTSGPQDSAELEVERIGKNRFKVTGLALHGMLWPSGPNIGELDCEIELEGFTGAYSFDRGETHYWAEFHFTGEGAVIRERGAFGTFGAGAFFDGVYCRVV